MKAWASSKMGTCVWDSCHEESPGGTGVLPAWCLAAYKQKRILFQSKHSSLGLEQASTNYSP